MRTEIKDSRINCLLEDEDICGLAEWLQETMDERDKLLAKWELARIRYLDHLEQVAEEHGASDAHAMVLALEDIFDKESDKSIRMIKIAWHTSDQEIARLFNDIDEHKTRVFIVLVTK